ncbi:PAS domain-containing protein [Mycolicibacterium goodii]|uniref:Rv3651-like N-terminal domain-containing protein n=1 Tax=Mycolicibacterium goodii TaxID=134601 RepID=A0A0K0X0P7_MYCGD|nr:hypothetical protein AFA91_03055 [Mycolicibacterium goodii]
MAHDWLLVETLGSEPAVVARGTQTKNLVPISVFLRRNPNLMAIQSAIGETVRAGRGLRSITPKTKRVIRTEVVRMTDGCIHGVQVWVGPTHAEPPERPIPGPLVWDLTTGVATDTRESIRNSGMDPDDEVTDGRTFADDLPTRDLNPSEAKVLSLAINPQPGSTICTTWDVTDLRGEPITVGFVARTMVESGPDGRDRTVCRAMNWRSERDAAEVPADYLAQRILDGLARPDVHRALVDLNNWKLLKWLDDPAPFIDWRSRDGGASRIHPDDAPHMERMTTEFETGLTTAVLRMRTTGGGWQPVHLTINRVELEPDTYAGLLALRLPSDAEVTGAGLG